MFGGLKNVKCTEYLDKANLYIALSMQNMHANPDTYVRMLFFFFFSGKAVGT